MELNFAQTALVEKLVAEYPGKTEFYPKHLTALADALNIPRREAFNIIDNEYFFWNINNTFSCEYIARY